MYALNQEAYNTALMDGNEVLPESGKCKLDWENENHYQLAMMAQRRIQVNNDPVLAARYLGYKYGHYKKPYVVG